MLLPVLVLALAACGGDATDSDAPAAQTTPATGSEPASEAEAGAAASDGGGRLTLGDTTWEVVPDVQCSFFAGGEVIEIAGHAADDEDVEIALSVDSGEASLSVQSPDGDWFSTPDQTTATVDDQTVAGSATVDVAGETAEATFEFTCP